MTPKPLVALVVALVLCAGPAHAFSSGRRDAAEELSAAQANYLHGEFKDALRAVEKSLSDARTGAAYELRARIWYVLNDPTRGKSDAQRALSELGSGKLGAADLAAQGGALLQLGRLDQALAALNDAVRVSNDAPDALAARARVWIELGKFSEARSDLDAALKTGGQVPLWLYARARLRYESGDNDGAIADLTDALRAQKDFPIAYGLLGAALARRGDLVRARKAYDRALALDASYEFAFLGRAALSLREGDKAAAFKDFEEAVRADAQDYAPYFNRAEAHWSAGERAAALADDRNVLTSPKLAPQAALAVGDRYMSLQLWNDAVAAYDRAADLGLPVKALPRRAKAWEALKKPQKALADLDAALKLQPDSTDLLVARGELEARLKHDVEALADLTRAARLAPKDAPVLVARASFYASRGKSELAQADFDSAIEADPDDADAYNDRGALRANAYADYDKALADVRKAVALRPGDPAYRFNLGMLDVKARQYLKAVLDFSDALALKGPAARVLAARAEAKFLLGDHLGAKLDIEAAIENDPKSAATYEELGFMRLRARQYEQAVRDLNQALAADGAVASVYTKRGLAYAGLGDLKSALSDLHRAVELDPRAKDAWTWLCQAERVDGDLKSSAQACASAAAVDSQYGPAYLQSALTRFELKQYARAIEDADAAWQLGVRRPQALLAKAASQVALRQYRDAHRTFLEALDMDPSVSSPYLGFTAGHPAGRDYLAAVIAFDAQMQQDGREPYSYIARGDALQSAGQDDKAVLEYTKALELDGNNADAYVGRALALAAQDSLEAAQTDLLRAVELEPDAADPRVRVAVVLTLRRAYTNALSELGKALQIAPKSAETHLRAGNAHYFLKEFDKALENYELAVAEDPLDARAQVGLGLGRLALGRRDDAVESFSRAIALDPLSDRAYRNRASTWWAEGKYGNAAADYRTASLVNTDPNLVDEYKRLIEAAQAKAADGKSSS
ncbi:MAG: tetratricopeptide repeat protein [Elusimicrobia bacterium]|nr:tetratricopeptide repeat protein [Elusimicrobiota bacterium]